MGYKRRKKKQPTTTRETLGEFTPRYLKKRRTSDFQFAGRTDGTPAAKRALDNQPKKTKKKKKKAVCQGATHGVSVAGSTLTDERLKPETALSKPGAPSPINSETGSMRTGSDISTNRAIFKQQLNKTGIFYVKGKLLDELLEKLSRAIESAKHTKGQVRDKIWLKQKFSVGINDVTRTLERMPTALDTSNLKNESHIEHLKVVQDTSQHFPASEDSRPEDKAPNKQLARSLGKPELVVELQVVLVASDCHPRVLVSHIPGLASSRGVPLLSISDHGIGSLRLGQLLKLTKATTIGIKVGESPINKTVQDILEDQSGRFHNKMDAEPKGIQIAHLDTQV